VPRPILYLLIAVAVIIIGLFALSSMDSEVPTTRVELPVTNATAR
jgi:hypothetical protein